MFDFYVDNAKDNIRSIWMYLCNRHGSVKTKAFDTLKHDFLIAKLGAYRFETDALKSDLTNR